MRKLFHCNFFYFKYKKCAELRLYISLLYITYVLFLSKKIVFYYRIFKRFKELSPTRVPSDMRNGRAKKFKIPYTELEVLAELRVIIIIQIHVVVNDFLVISLFYSETFLRGTFNGRGKVYIYFLR